MANMIQSHALMEKVRRDTIREMQELYPDMEPAPGNEKDIPMLRRLASTKEQMHQRRKVRRRKLSRKKRTEPAIHVPRCLEEAPLRRQDRRTLNALLQRRADKHMIICILCTSSLIITLGVTSLVVWQLYRKEYNSFGPFIIAGPVFVLCGVFLLTNVLEIGIRLYRQTARVMDRSLLNTNNLHEVKHWIEPDLVNFGWGHMDFVQEAETIDQQNLRKLKPLEDRFV